MDILQNFSKCQSILYKTCDAEEIGSLSTLNEFCAELFKCCNKLHKLLVFDCQGKFDIVEVIFLCLNQIICCIKYLEKTIKVEQSSNFTLSPTRQYFLDRILWCFARIKSLISSINDDVFFTSTFEETCFIDILDTALEYLAPYTTYDHEKINDKSTFTLEALSDIRKLRTAIDNVISQTLAFANVSSINDKKIVTVLCQKVLKDCLEFEKECRILLDGAENNNGNENNIHLKAVILESALYKLEDFVNESLLRLIYQVFANFNEESLENIRQMIKDNPDDEKLDDLIADFDINVDRLMQIGMFAIAFAPNSEAKTNVRSCLASLETLDSNLIPSLYGQCNLHSTILEEHFLEEVSKLKMSLQKIVETVAFTESYLNILNESLTKESFNLKSLEDIIGMSKILIEHIELNKSEFILNNKNLKFDNFENFKLMTKECQAVLSCANQVGPDRILKRFKVMKSCLKKFYENLKSGTDLEKQNDKKMFVNSEDLEESQNIFESFGISPSIKNILYQSKRDRNNLTGSLIAQCSIKLNFSSTSEKTITSPEKKGVRRRDSLRTAMFKRHKNEETQRIYKIYSENSMNLGLTDILDQLTDLSSSFQNITISNSCKEIA